ncbi:MAG: phospholipid/cholesterol/gamma-HCH transport system substrate-binding protein [Crocinitomix sp.]|jgi:phospholipid/cholesterol/gamma-HCH transport system substrate-binding protein
MKVSKEFKVGLLVVLGLLLLFVGVNFLKGGSLFGEDRVYYTEFSNSQGLQVSNEVQLNGLKIGQVKAVDLHPNDPNTILVQYTIDNKELQIPKGSEIELISSDILGTKALQLNLSAEPNITSFFESGDTLLGSIEPSLEDQINEQILPLKKKTEELIGSVDAIIVSVGAFWDTSAAYTIDESLYEVRDAIGTFAELADNLSILITQETDMVTKILKDVSAVTDNLASKSEQISNTIDNISAISDTLADSDLKGVIDETKATLTELNGVLADVNAGNGSLGKLLHTDSLHTELLETNQSIQNLLDDMEAHPEKYVHFSLLGRKPKK